MKTAILLLLFIFTNLIALDITLVPYTAKDSYTNSSNKSSKINGFYTKFKEPNYSIELDYETMSLESNSTTTKQTDYTLAYAYFIKNNYKIKTLYHQISNNAKTNSKVKAYLLGVEFYKKSIFNLGINLSYSSYDETSLAKEVYQTSPYFKISFGDYKSTMGKYVLKLDANGLYPKAQDTNTTSIKNNSSFGISLQQFKGDFSNMFSYYKGEEIFAVKDNGFSINNLNQLYTSGFSLSTRYRIYDDMGIKLLYKSDKFTAIDTNMDGERKRYLLLFDYTIK